MHKGDIIEYTDERGAKHEATIVIVHEQAPPLSDPNAKPGILLTLEFHADGRDKRAELVSSGGNISGQCYGKVLKKANEDDDSDTSKQEDTEPTVTEDSTEGNTSEPETSDREE